MSRGKPALAFLAATLGVIGICSVAGDVHAQHKRTPAPKDAVVYFHTPLNGQSVPHEFVVRIGLKNMGVAPAGVDKPNTGHHHVIIDAPLPPLDEPIPSDFNHIHLGNGQTEVRLTLPPGRHTLQLLLADQNHIPHDPPVMSQKITIRVRPGGD